MCEKGEVHPISCHEGTEEQERYSCTLSLTSALDGGGWLMPCHVHFTPINDTVPTVWEAGWSPGLVWSGWMWKLLSPLGFYPCTVQPVAICYTDYAIPANKKVCWNNKIYAFQTEMSSVLRNLLTCISNSTFLTPQQRGLNFNYCSGQRGSKFVTPLKALMITVH
jgi:hypothetical protein